jgi:hypothetical protein
VADAGRPLRFLGVIATVLLGTYAVYLLVARPSDQGAATRAASKARARDKPRAAESSDAPTAVPVTKRAPSLRPAPQELPKVDVEHDRDELGALVDRLDAMVAHGEHMTQADWTDTYRKGNELVMNLLRAPETKDQAVHREIDGLAVKFRQTILKVQPEVPKP